MKTVIAEILPLAIVVTVSPINIIAEILLLFSRKPLTNGLCYLVGFVVGVAAVVGGLVALAGAFNLSAGSGPSRGAALVMLVLGVFLLVVAVRKFRGRPRGGEEATMPGWMDGIAGFAPGRSLGVGVLVGAFNPKNIVVGFAAALSIAEAGLSTAQDLGVLAVYVVVAVLGVAAPLVVVLVLGDRAQPILAGWRDWLGQNNAAVMSVLYLIFGVILIGKGIAGL